VRPPAPADAPAVFALVAACDEAVLGYPDVSVADVEDDLAHDARRQLVVVDGERAVGWVWVTDKAAGRTPADVYVDPQLTIDDPALADELARWGWDCVLAQAASIAADRGLAATAVETGTLDGDAVGRRRAAAAGLTPVRTFWRMRRTLTLEDREPAAAPGITVRPVAPEETRSAYELVEAAFADHWNYAPRTYDEWWAQHSGSGFDLDLWWLAELDGQPAGVLIASRQMADEDAIYIAVLATRREARRRGVAKALLHKAFARGLAEGWSTAKLNVDSESSTSAPALYAGVGMTVEFAVLAWRRQVTVAFPDR
jgi:GNAT superfamily N-acetyltransferase